MAEQTGSWVLADIMACSYCRHYKWVGTHGASQFCQNKESPYYNPSSPEHIGTQLTSEQDLRGCEKIDYNGQKIPEFLFKKIPKDSNLRNIPHENVVDGFNEGMDLESELTASQLMDRFKEQKTLDCI